MKASTRDRLLFFLGGFFLISLLGLLVFDLSRKGVYSQRMGVNVAVIGEKGVGLLLLRPDEEMVGWVVLPGNVRIKVFNSGARYPLESIWSYGVSSKNSFEVVEKSLGQSMGVIVAKTVKLDSEPRIEDVLGRLFTLGLKTDLSIRDRIEIRRFLADAVRSKKVLEMTVPGSVFDKVVDPDGAEFLEFNRTMGLWTKNKFVVESVLDENADISINNISGVSGAGNILSDQLESIGMHVVEVKASPEESIDGRGCLYSTGIRYEMTELVLKDQLGCGKVPKPEFLEDNEKLRIWIK